MGEVGAKSRGLDPQEGVQEAGAGGHRASLASGEQSMGDAGLSMLGGVRWDGFF
jgi:hypothetical protein